MIRLLSLLFPVWAILLSLIAFYFPSSFVVLKSGIIYLLGLIMFAMGMTLKAQDFIRVFKRPVVIAVGILLQFGIMPMVAFLVSVLLDLPRELLIGMLLVGAAPGGTASNVICYLAKADVALSVSLTLVSTLLAIVLMPLLSWLYLHQTVEINAIKMLLNIGLIVLLPLAGGVLFNAFFEEKVGALKKIFPLISMSAIVLIIAIVVALNKENISHVSLWLASAVVLHNAIGLSLGYSISKLLGYDIKTCRTIAIEVGMQNSGLAVAIAGLHFASLKLVALPGALFSIWHNLSGALLASLWHSSESDTKKAVIKKH